MRKALLIAIALLSFASAQAQDGYPIRDIFYGTRAVNLMTTSQVGKKVLAYRISHRFGVVNSGIRNFVGLDGPGVISIAFDYGITDDLMLGVARDNFNKIYSGFVKYNILNQKTDNSMPLSLSVYSRANIISQQDLSEPNQYDPFANRMSYITQLMVARKFGERLAVQVSPTFIHHNLVNCTSDANSMFAISGAAQLRLTKRLGLTGEYTYMVTPDAVTYPEGVQGVSPVGSASLGLDIVTGGHVFQIVLTNSAPINEAFALPYTLTRWFDGDFRIGFNISRKFWL